MEFAQQLKSSVDIVRVIGEYVRLRKASGNRYQGLCPFHREKTPSFSVYTHIQAYKCFGCGETGDVIKFIEKIENLSFYEALKTLAERNNIPMPKRAEYTDAESKLRGALQEMHDLAARIFQAGLRSSGAAQARDYIARRGVSQQLVEEFGLGFADPSGQALVRKLRDEGYTPQQMEESGLVRRREDGSFYDYFRGRLIFPIHSESGKVVAFAGRTLKDEEPKYLNSPQTKIYQKSNVLYNLFRARRTISKSNYAILVEGYMDVIGVYSAGIGEVVASCGTALTSWQVAALRRHSDRVVVNFDPDRPGAAAAERSIQIFLAEGSNVRVLELEGGLDPDEYVKERGADVYRKNVENATNYFHWLADRALKKFGNSAEARIEGFRTLLLPAIQVLPDKLERLAVADEVANFLRVDRGAVLEQFRKTGNERKKAAAPAKPGVPAMERILLRALLTDDEARETVLPHLSELPLFKQMVTRPVLEAMLAAGAPGQGIEFSQIEGRLDENSKALLHEVAFADDIDRSGVPVEEALACVRALEQSDLEARRSALRARVKEAERAGNLQEALAWNKELLQLERRGISDPRL